MLWPRRHAASLPMGLCACSLELSACSVSWSSCASTALNPRLPLRLWRYWGCVGVCQWCTRGRAVLRYMSGKLLLKLEAVNYILAHHTVRHLVSRSGHLWHCHSDTVTVSQWYLSVSDDTHVTVLLCPLLTVTLF